jgi:hypothetical protein
MKKQFLKVAFCFATSGMIAQTHTFNTITSGGTGGQFAPFYPITWNTSAYGSGFAHKIYNDDYGGRTYLKIAGRHNSATFKDIITVSSDEQVGIGTNNPVTRLTIMSQEGPQALGAGVLSAMRLCNNYAQSFGARSELQFGLSHLQNERIGVIAGEYSQYLSGVCGDLVFGTSQSSTIYERMRITYGGNLLINKTSQVNQIYKLDVNGLVRANEIVVNTNGADFVFDDNYNLTSLQELEAYIQKNNHLPGIDPADKMQREGMLVGDLNTKLLQKIEELTLYVIELEKKVEKLSR